MGEGEYVGRTSELRDLIRCLGNEEVWAPEGVSQKGK